MKNRIIINCLLMLVVTGLSSCFMQKTDKFAPNTYSSGQIMWVLPEASLIGSAYQGVVQPSMDVIAARFSKATSTSPNFVGTGTAGTLVITSNLNSGFTNLTINMYLASAANPLAGTGTNQRETKATFTNVSGSVTWTIGLTGATGLQYNGSTTGLATGNYVLEFVASNADGSQTTTRVFTVTIIA